VIQTRIIGALLLAALASHQSPRAAVDCPEGVEKKVIDGKHGRIEYCARSNGTLHGPAAEWYPNGVQRTQDSWKEGKKDGTWIAWDEKGTKREERSYVDGKLDGEERIWFENGNLKTLTTWQDGVRNGAIAQWLESGTQVVWGEFHGDKENGIWTFRGPPDHERDVSYAIFVDGEDVTKEIFATAPDDCSVWAKLPAVERAGAVAVVNLLVLEKTSFWKGTKDRAQVAACLASHAMDAARKLDAACQRGEALDDVITTALTGATAECMAADRVRPSQR